MLREPLFHYARLSPLISFALPSSRSSLHPPVAPMPARIGTETDGDATKSQPDQRTPVVGVGRRRASDATPTGPRQLTKLEAPAVGLGSVLDVSVGMGRVGSKDERKSVRVDEAAVAVAGAGEEERMKG
jgi:hypothetical protein